MKWSIPAFCLILLGVLGVGFVIMFQELTTNSENDYYLLKEVTEASMLDALDYGYYYETGDLKISKEKFVESFIRRYAESTIFIYSTHSIKFFDIMETPPKATIIIDTGIGSFSINNYDYTSDLAINNYLSAILEFGGKKDEHSSYIVENWNYVHKYYEQTYYSAPYVSSQNFETHPVLNKPEELSHKNIYNEDISGSGMHVPRISNIQVIGVVSDQGELIYSKLKRDVDWEIHSDTVGVDTDTDEITNMVNFDIDNYAQNVTNISIANNKSGCGGATRDDCYALTVKGTNNDFNTKKRVVIKFKVIWEYYEYEYDE